MKKKKNSLLTGIIVGGAVGSVLSLLFTSKNGRKKTKEVSKKLFIKGKNTAEKFLNKYK